MQQHAPSFSNRSSSIRAGLQLVALVAIGAGAGACNQVDWQDVVDQIHHDHPQPPPPPTDDPCAKVNCGINARCIVLETYPPQARCEVIEPATTCRSSSECAPDQVCTTEQGDCQVPPVYCPEGAACAAALPVCVGKCVPGKVDPQPNAECKVDSDCQLHSNYCGGCSCDAYNPSMVAPAACPASDAVKCFADPCQNAAAVCVAGQCQVGPVPTPAPKCTDTQLQGSETSCKSYDTWKSYAADACEKQGLRLAEFSVGGGECDGGTRYSKYTCCSAIR